MIIRKLRLQKGWSQEQLSQLSGISTRTIQRMEQGQTGSLESLKSLAAVFEVNFDELQQEPKEMNTQTVQANQNAQITHDEELAIHYVKKVRRFYLHLLKFVVVVAILFVVNYLTLPDYIWAWWVLLGWGTGVTFHALKVFKFFNLFGPEWEKKKIEERLGRKL